MKTTGIVRQMDTLGRIVLPIELRRTLDIAQKDSLEICVEGNQISRFVFNDCVIDINGVLLCRANSTYSHCKIRCGRIKVSLPSTKDSLIMDGNIFYLKNNTQTKPTILFDRISSRSEDEYNTVLQNNVFLN